jgi:heme a synthase
MRERFAIAPRTYFLVSAIALGALTLIVFTGAAVRVTGSGLGCPSWPNCYDNGRLVAETDSHALIEFGNRMLTSFVGFAAAAAGLLAFFRRPFRRDLAILGVLLPLGVMAQAILGGLTVRYGLAPGYVMGHYALSAAILVAAGALAWRAHPGFDPAAAVTVDRATARGVWALFVFGAITLAIGTAATAAGPHAGGSGTGDIVHRLNFYGADTLTWLINRHGVLASALGVLAVVTWWLARRGGAPHVLRKRLTRICVLMAVQGVVGIVQYRLRLPAEIVWVHVALATLLWVGIVLAAVEVGSPRRAPVPETAEAALSAAPAGAGSAPASAARP